MADIDVVKKSSHMWIWVVVGIAILLALYMMMGRGGNRANSGNTTGSLRPATHGVEQGVSALAAPAVLVAQV